MKQQDVFKKIGTILKELNEQYEYLSEGDNHESELEVDFFAANANFLRDHAEILRKLNAKASPKPVEVPIVNTPVAPVLPPPVEEIPASPVEATPAPVEVAPTPEPVKPGKEKQSTVFEEKFFEPVVQRLTPGAKESEDDASESEETTEPETIRHELIIDEADIWEDEDEELYSDDDTVEVEAEEIVEEISVEEEPAELIPAVKAVEEEPVEAPAVAHEPVVIPIESTVIIEPKNDDPVVTINQKISVLLGDKKAPAQLPVTDLKSAINLNDKLLYIKDLFNGYSLAYSEAIEILNRFSSLQEAERFLNANYVSKNNWESKPATTQKFYALLQRRYA